MNHVENNLCHERSYRGNFSKKYSKTNVALANMMLSSGETIEFTKSIFKEDNISDFLKVYTMKMFIEEKHILEDGIIEFVSSYEAEKELKELTQDTFADPLGEADLKYEIMKNMYLKKEENVSKG